MNSRMKMHEEAVSPVIGVILMVAITVVLAAVVGMYVMNQAEAIPDSKSVTLTAEKSFDNGETNIAVTIMGGSDLSTLRSLVFKLNGKPVDSGITCGDISGSSGAIDLEDDKEFSPGDVIIIKGEESGKLTIAGKFSDGSEALLLTKNF